MVATVPHREMSERNEAQKHGQRYIFQEIERCPCGALNNSVHRAHVSMREGCRGVQVKIESKDIDARLTKEPELSPQRMFRNQMANGIFRDMSFGRDTGDLKFGSGRCDIRV